MLDSARTSIRHYYHRYRTYRYGWGLAVSLVEDRSGDLWVSTRSELMRLDPSTGAFTYFRHDPQNPESINSDLPTHVYRDRSDVIWVGTNGYGINTHDPKANRFQTFRRPQNWPVAAGGVQRLHTVRGSLGNALDRRWSALPMESRDRRIQKLRDQPRTDPTDFGNTGRLGDRGRSARRFCGPRPTRDSIATRSRPAATGITGTIRPIPRGFPKQVVYDVFRDRDGVIWAVTENLSR